MKDCASFYCAYVLCISGLSEELGFLRTVHTNTIFARFMATGKQTLASAVGIQKRKLGLTTHFSN